MFITTTAITVFFVALFFIGVRNEENERIAKEHKEAHKDN
jgi:hypothetical protein